MNVTAPFSILLVQPPTALSAGPPSTMAQVRKIFSDRSIQTHRWDAHPDGLSPIGKHVLDLLEQLSARHDTIHLVCPDEIEPAGLKDLLMVINQRRPRLRLSLSSTIDRSIESEIMTVDNDSALVQIQWHVRGPLPDVGFFKAFSGAGIWNHLVVHDADASLKTCRTIASQPNIIHSWETTGTVDRGCHANEDYGQVRPLPGRPLWQAVNDPVNRFLLVDRLTKDRVLRLRLDDDQESLYALGDALEYHFLPPDRLPAGYLDEICAMVAAGGTVATTHVRFNLERAHLIGYVQEKGVIVGNSSLKNPRPEYIQDVRRQSGLDLTGYLERGYTSVRPEYRGLGIGTRLLEGLTRRAGDRKIFSVIAEDNAATKVIAMRNRTRQVATYFSEKAGKPVGIWMPEWMIDTQEGKTS
ncbi:MAG: GNAT family N-acetyltransferase [Deltaproteobacteria bacterium]|nr:GNAT family N-acetyltransferase [Deltaproteobacteria bacterium]